MDEGEMYPFPKNPRDSHRSFNLDKEIMQLSNIKMLS